MQLSWQHENGNLKSYIDVSFINDIKNQLEFLRGQWKEWVWREWEKERSGWWWKGMGRLARVVVATTEEKNFLKKISWWWCWVWNSWVLRIKPKKLPLHHPSSYKLAWYGWHCYKTFPQRPAREPYLRVMSLHAPCRHRQPHAYMQGVATWS
jgi:hypothetical protein